MSRPLAARSHSPHSVCSNSPARRTPRTRRPPMPPPWKWMPRIIADAQKTSEIMKNLGYLSDVIGPRLTGSANVKRANEWAPR